MISLKQTATELLLYVPYSHRHRAKKIEGRRWDSARKCWVYRRTSRALDEVLLEFGDELDPASSDLQGLTGKRTGRGRMRPKGDSGREPQSAATLGGTRDAVKGDLEEAQELRTIEKVREELGAQVKRKDDELALANSRIHELEAELAGQAQSHSVSAREAEARAQEELHRKQQRISELEATVSDLKREAVQVGGLDGSVHAVLRAVFPADPSIDNLARSARMNADLPVSIARRLEADLRTVLADTDRTDFFDLINQSGEADILSQEALDLAHLIRKQRNRLLHSDPDGASSDSIRLARNLLALSAMRIVLVEVGKQSNARR